MLDKLFVRVRSWLHIDPTDASAVSATGLAGVPGPAISGASLSGTARSPRNSPARDATPPPLPAEAFSLVMEAQPESGMVITESGIIIIDPNSSAVLEAVDAEPGKANQSDSWAVPNTAPSHPPAPARADSYGDWDTVLARARAQLSPPDKSKTRK